MRKLKLCILSIIILISICCGNGNRSKHKYWDISKFEINKSALIDNEKIKLLYSSRGTGTNKITDYYIHIIVVSQQSGDTVNVLTTALNGFKESDADKVFNFFDENNFISTISNPKSLKFKKVYRDPQFDQIANNNYSTIVGSIGVSTPNKD